MENTSIPSNICNFNSIECNGTIRSITHNTKIPKSTESIISVGMYLCQIHYNRFILNEIRNINYNKSCELPKHDEYKNQSKNTKKKSKKLILEKVPKRLIKVLGLNKSSKICGMCKYRTDKDPEYLQDKNYKAPISIKINNLDDNNNLQNKSIEAIVGIFERSPRSRDGRSCENRIYDLSQKYGNTRRHVSATAWGSRAHDRN